MIGDDCASVTAALAAAGCRRRADTLMFMRSVEELKTIEDSVRFAHVPVHQLRLEVAHALAALPEKYRQIIFLRDLEELTIREIAQRLTISDEAAKSLLRRARAAARKQLTEGTT